MLDVALRKPDGSRSVDPALLRPRAVTPLAVAEALHPVLPDGLRRGSTVSVSNSVSLVLATLGAASDEGAWIALVGFPLISAEVAAGFGIELRRLALVPDPGTQWTVAVGALLDAMDVVAVRPPARALAPADVRRLAARARKQQSVLVPYLSGAGAATGWPGADVRLRAEDSAWHGTQDGHGRLRARRMIVQAEGRGTAARPRRAELWLPGDSGLTAGRSRPSLAVVRQEASDGHEGSDGLVALSA